MRPRILLAALADWAGPVRLPQALRQAGFETGLLGDPEGLIAQSSHIDYRYEIKPAQIRLGRIGPLLHAIEDFNPRLVIPCDEAAVHLLENLAMAWGGAHGPGGQFRVALAPRVREILLRSLGDQRSFAIRSSRPLARKAAELLGVAAPPSAPVPYLQVAEGFAREHGFPVMLTREGLTDGDRVRVCADLAALRAAYTDLTQPVPRTGRLRHALDYAWWSVATGLRLAGDLTRPLADGPALAVEARVPGHPASYTMIAWEGRPLAGIAAYTETVHPAASGAASVVRLVNDAPMAEAARKLVGRFGFTGFGGLDFMRDETANKLWFLKFNPRPTPLSHLGALAGGDLCAALQSALTNVFPAQPRPLAETTVALFPQDWLREPDDARREAAHFDIPENDDRLLAVLRARFNLPPAAAAGR